MIGEKEEAYKLLLDYSPRIKLDINDLRDKRILFITPHPDDETLGCGGIISKLVDTDAVVEVVLCTDDNVEDELGEKGIRLKEFQEAISILGVDKVFYMGQKDGTLKANNELLAKQIARLIIDQKIDWIFIPYILDVNEDHRAVARILAKSLSNIPSINVAMYEVWTPILYPNLYVDITDTYSNKVKAISCYSTQEQLYNIKSKVEGMDRLRTSLLMKKTYQHVEAFKTFKAPVWMKIATILT